MTYIKYFWGFDSSTEGWTGDNLKWEDGGVGGLPTPHIYGQESARLPAGGSTTIVITFKSPRNISINSGDIICFVFTYSWTVVTSGVYSLKGITVEIVDSSETVVWSKTLSAGRTSQNTPCVCIVKAGADGVGINIKINIWVRATTALTTFHAYGRVDSVTVYQQPDQVIYTPIPSTLQATVTHEIPINRSGSFVVGALRLDPIKNLTSYDEKIVYDSSSEYDYSDKVTSAKKTTSSVDKITITHCADSTLQVYYECDHAVWLLDANTYYPSWLVIVKCYHNQNITNPDTLSFSATLDGSSPYSATKSMSLKFEANGLFKLYLSPSVEIIGDTTGITSLKSTIEVKDSSGNVIGTTNYDILNNSFDKDIEIGKNYDGQDLTIDISVSADGKVSSTVTVKLKLNFKFTYE